MRSSRQLAAACIAIALALPAPAAAQGVAAAAALFEQGVADMQAGRYETGCPAIGESHRLDPRAGTLFTLAECEARRGLIATAVAHYTDYLSMIGRMEPKQQAKQRDREAIAAKKKAELEPQVPRLTLVLPEGAPAGTVVMRDGAVFSPVSLGVALPVDPGEHVVTVQSPGRPPREIRVTITAGENKRIELPAEPEAPLKAARPPVRAETPAPPPPDEPGARRIGAYVAGAVGIAGLALGGITGGLALGKKGDITARCNAQKVCDHQGKLEADSAQALGLVSTIGFGAGIAGLGAFVVLLVTEPSPTPSVARAPLDRLRASVLAAGPTGAALGVEGAW